MSFLNIYNYILMHEALWDPPTRKRERNIMHIYKLNIMTYCGAFGKNN